MLCFFDFPASAARISYAPGMASDVFNCVVGTRMTPLIMDRLGIPARASTCTCLMYRRRRRGGDCRCWEVLSQLPAEVEERLKPKIEGS